MRGGETTEKRRKEEDELLGMINEIRTASSKRGADDTDDGLSIIATLLIRICALNNADYVRGYLQGRLDGIKNRKDKEARHDP